MSDHTLTATPKHQRVKERLRKQILDGVLAPGTRLPPDSELHKRFRVHRLTAIRALNDLVNEGLIVRRRGSGTYVAGSDRAPAILHGRSLKLGIVWRSTVSPQWMLNTFLGQATLGAVEAMGLNPAEAHWPLVKDDQVTRAVWSSKELGIHVECIGESHASMVRHPPIDDVRVGDFDGILAIGIIDGPFQDELLSLGIPVVLGDVLTERLNGRLDQVFVDPQQGYRQAVEHFASAGLKRIHFVGAQISLPAPSTKMTFDAVQKFRADRVRVDPDSFLRFSAYRQAMDQRGLDAPENFVHRMNSINDSEAALAGRLAALPKNERPEAVICHEYDQAERIIGEFERRGLSLQGAGACGAQTPQKSIAIRTDMKTLGATALDLLVSRIQRPKRPYLRVGIPMFFDHSAETRNQTVTPVSALE